ncbi:IS630 family transposase [Vibrio cholerae]
MAIIAPIDQAERRRIHKAIQHTADKGFARRLMAMLLLAQGQTIVAVSETIGAARSSIGRWINWYTDGGIDALKSQPSGRPCSLPVEQMCAILLVLIQASPQDFGFQRSRWSTELLAYQLNKTFKSHVAASTVRRWLPKMGVVWRRAAPTLRIKDPEKAEKLAAIQKALDQCDPENTVFYEDEVDIDLNPKIGADWTFKGQQKKVVTPGKNEKHYLAGALHAKTGKVIYVSGTKKDSNFFIAMLEKLKRHYRRAKKIILVLDNYVIHKSRKTNSWLAANPKFVLLFQPVYCPWVNVIERLWHALHETITRNHQCKYMHQLLAQVKHFMATASPYPGSGHGMAKKTHN